MNELQRYERADMQEALRVLREGGVILYPTDTIWGIGCDATNAEAVQRIYAIKHREDSKSMLCLLDKPGKLGGYVTEVPSMAWDLIEVSNKPLTIIYPAARNIAPNLLAEDGSVGIRISQEPFTQMLCQQLHAPLVSTSANISGEPAPACFRDIRDEIKESVDYICQFRQNDTRKFAPSSIIKLGVNNEVEVIR